MDGNQLTPPKEMTTRQEGKQGGQLFIVDNSDRDWKVRNYLEQWADLSVSFDPDFFKSTLGIHSLAGHFRKMEKDLEQIVFG